MDDWQKQCWKQIEKTAADIEEFWVNVEEATESFVDEVSETVGSFLEKFHSGVVEEVDNMIEDVVEVLIATSDEIDAALTDEWDHLADDDFTTVNFSPPSVLNNPACINCAHYHGQSYNGNLLVCAMHPHGWEDEHCPDWEKDY
jgi:hypothetical protein